MIKDFHKDELEKKKKPWHEKSQEVQKQHQKKHFPDKVWPSDSEKSKHKGPKI